MDMLTLSDNIVQHRAPKWSSSVVDLDDETSLLDRETLAARATDVGRWIFACKQVEVSPVIFNDHGPLSGIPWTVCKEVDYSSADKGTAKITRDFRSSQNADRITPATYVYSNAPRKAARWEGVRVSLARWETLKDGWAGQGSVAPSSDSIRKAREIVGLLEVLRVPAPSKFIDAEGEFGFRWSRDPAAAAIVFAVDGNLIGFVRTKAGRVEKLDKPVEEAAHETGFFLKLLQI
ncbi:hypothetical protein G7077_01320 [Sphingomonas piscis]|uniref:Uncharacterized protein n=1 Tax=Sphingomonas piscis TaxID=2714943 RepID=A0A6G7YLY3_9SPHN|nr:hypothetical protein [Sphingomonas piscis]QIK77753.1 hypothetical protein G7077_01320 [Sphingomonas piscis]